MRTSCNFSDAIDDIVTPQNENDYYLKKRSI